MISRAASGLVLLLLLLSPSPAVAVLDAQTEDDAPVGVWPLQPRPEVVEGFDPPDHPWLAGHRGVDLAGHIGQPVRAALAGTVTFAGLIAGKAVVVVDHGATRTTYEPVAASVAVGDSVTAGQVIGTLELFGSHCFPAACLHWGLIETETYLDPLRLVGAGPVRLLPLFGSLQGARLPPATLSRFPSGPSPRPAPAVTGTFPPRSAQPPSIPDWLLPF